MTGVTEIVDNVAETLRLVDTLARVMAPSELTENIPDVPLIQVYPETGQTDARSNTDRTTFRAGVRVSDVVVNVDVYARQRSHIGEDMAAVMLYMDEVINVLEAQKTSPYFNTHAIKAFSWTWQRTTFAYGDPATNYVGIRFVLTLTVF